MSEPETIKSAGGIAPFGYRWQRGALVIDEREAPVRKLIYELFLKHRRKKTVAGILNDLGYRTRGGALFSDTTIDRLLRDTTAKGIRLVEGREIKIEPVVEAKVWEQANNLLNAKQQPEKQPAQLFSGIAYCSCGGKMLVPGGSEKYVCANCRHKIPAEDLEEIFAAQLVQFPIELGNNSVSKVEQTLADFWQDLTFKEKRLIAEQITNKIIVGRDTVNIEFGCQPHSLKTAAVGQHNKRGNKTPENEAKNSIQETSSSNITEPLMNETEAARFLGISRMTLLRKRNAGEIKFFRVGHRVLYSKEKHLVPYLERCEKEN